MIARSLRCFTPDRSLAVTLDLMPINLLNFSVCESDPKLVASQALKEILASGLFETLLLAPFSTTFLLFPFVKLASALVSKASSLVATSSAFS